LKILESPGIKMSNFQELGKSWNQALVLENPGKLLEEFWKVLENKWLWVEMQTCSKEKRSGMPRKQ